MLGDGLGDVGDAMNRAFMNQRAAIRELSEQAERDERLITTRIAAAYEDCAAMCEQEAVITLLKTNRITLRYMAKKFRLKAKDVRRRPGDEKPKARP